MRKRNPTLGLCLRLLVAGYLLYIAYVQFSSLSTTDHFALSLVFGILFTAVGVFFAIWAFLTWRRDSKPEPEPEPEEQPEADPEPEPGSEEVIDVEAGEVEKDDRL